LRDLFFIEGIISGENLGSIYEMFAPRQPLTFQKNTLHTQEVWPLSDMCVDKPPSLFLKLAPAVAIIISGISG